MIVNNRRCPWCGNTLPILPYFRISLDKNSHKCKVCKRSSSVAGISNFVFIIIILIIFMITICLPILEVFKVIVSIFLAIMLLIYTIKTPMVRIGEGKWYEDISDLLIGTASVRWYTKKENGINFPNIRIWNNYILPICFVDSSEKPISQVICVRLHKVKEFNKVDLYQLSDTVNLSKLNYGTKFYIYNDNHKIGEGILLQ